MTNKNASHTTCLRAVDLVRLLCPSEIVAFLGSSSLFSLPALQSFCGLTSHNEPIATTLIELSGPVRKVSVRLAHPSCKNIGHFRKDVRSVEIYSSVLTVP